MVDQLVQRAAAARGGARALDDDTLNRFVRDGYITVQSSLPLSFHADLRQRAGASARGLGRHRPGAHRHARGNLSRARPSANHALVRNDHNRQSLLMVQPASWPCTPTS